MNRQEKKAVNVLRSFVFSIKTCFLASNKYFFFKFIILIFTTVIPLINIWIWKEIINRIIDNIKFEQILTLLIVYLANKICLSLIAKIDAYVNNRYADELQFYIEDIIIKKTSRMPLYYFDFASVGDKVRRTRSNFNMLTSLTWLVFDILSAFISVVSILVVVISYKWWIGIFTVMLLLPYMLYNNKHMNKSLAIQKEQIRDKRKQAYYSNIFFDNAAQFEIKLNNTGDYFIKKYQEIWKKLYKINQREDIKCNVINMFVLMLNALSEIFVLISSAYDVFNNALGVGDMQYNVNMVSRLRAQVGGLMANINRFIVNCSCLNELYDFINIKSEIEECGEKIPSANPKIEFCNVIFKYPNSSNFVLNGCSFVINPFEKVSIVGNNGSGKTTIIKLLFRFYEVNSGEILLDGINIKEYNIYDVRKIFGILFQDYVTYCLPLREIISLPSFQDRYRNEMLNKACVQSGFNKVIENWEEGYDSVLGRFYMSGGKDLSGGQWQLLGLSRAYFKDSQYIVLDEPSASLDPIAEDQIFEHMYKLSAGKNAITISHRLSQAVEADKLLLIEHGKIVEQGTHQELMNKKGKYARLFMLQANRYLEKGEQY